MKALYDINFLNHIQNILYNEELDEILKKEFLREMKKSNPQELNKIRKEIEENHYEMYSDEIICFYLLALKLKDAFLNCDEEFQDELCSCLVTSDVSPLNYANYTKLFLTPHLYKALKLLTKTSINHSYTDIFYTLLSINDLLGYTESEYNELVKKIHNIGEGKLYIIFSPDETFSEIYQKILTLMHKHNQKFLTFTPRDFETLTILLTYSSYDSESQKTIMENLLAIQNKYKDEITITRKILEHLKKPKIISLTRKRKENNHDKF